MDDEIKDGEELNAKDLNDANEAPADGKGEEHSDYKPVNRFDASAVHHLSGMYRTGSTTMLHTLFWSVPSPTSRTA